MNSLNIVSRLTATPTASRPPSRRSSTTDSDGTADGQGDQDSRETTADSLGKSLSERLGLVRKTEVKQEKDDARGLGQDLSEKTPLLSDGSSEGSRGGQRGHGWQLPRRVAEAVLYGVSVVFTTIAAPGRYVIACFYDEQGHFSAILPLKNLKNLMSRRKRKSAAQAVRPSAAPEEFSSSDEKKPLPQKRRSHLHKRSPSIESTASTASAVSTDGETEDSPAEHTRSKSALSQPGSESSGLPRKSIRIKDQNEDALRKRKSQRSKKAANPDDVAAVASALKSPSSPPGAALKMTRYPRAPAPPRPLVPRRQPSYTLSHPLDAPKKTLIIDLDETLIHSMAKGGRMSTGHMVEVRLGGPMSSSGYQIGPGVPILYYVHERPGCHEFLRKICRWYRLVVFTASVQEYADPVIDWLERERKYFSGRYYRQHCTLRNGAYIKDLAQVEPDLSKVMILDNSPMSYIFHEDNAIPIEGWISDPTDRELLHLVPLLEGLQYVTDVRALLALRQGQAQQA